MEYRVVVFDLFGTLVNAFSTKEHTQALSQMAQVLGAPPELFVPAFDEDTRYARDAGRFPTIEANIEYVCRGLDLTIDGNQIRKAADLRIEFTRSALSPRVGVPETIHKLKANGFMIGLISDCSPEVPLLWPDTKLAPLIDETIFSCSEGLKKPDARIYKMLCDRMGVIPSECVYIGDGGSSELSGAMQVGMRPILLRVAEEETLDAYRPEAESWQGEKISSIPQLLDLLLT